MHRPPLALGSVGLSPHHLPYPGANGSDVVAVSEIIRAQVAERLGITLEPEVRLLGTFTHQNIDKLRRKFVPGGGEPAWARVLGAPEKGSG